jgi:hypothetical protein
MYDWIDSLVVASQIDLYSGKGKHLTPSVTDELMDEDISGEMIYALNNIS